MPLKHIFFVVIYFCCCFTSPAAVKLEWSFCKEGSAAYLSAQVPGTVHQDLLRHHRIPNPYWGTNIDSIQWVGKSNWVYQTQFNYAIHNQHKQSIQLVFEGIDTYADIYFNNVLIGKTDNMFRTWRFDISKLIQAKNNTLKVILFAIEPKADSLAKQYATVLPCENTRNFVRKAQYHFGWDFAPRILTLGIWKPVTIIEGEENEPMKAVHPNVELVQEADSLGSSFFFKINKQAVFMKGANWVPADMFLPSISDARYRHLLVAAKQAGVNMLRVWGGGIYEQDIFYQLCDSLGIYVWQDLMFAGAMYPSDAQFKQSVFAEIKDNVLRLRKYKCIVLWCGNNEIDEAWHNWGWTKSYQLKDTTKKELWDAYQLFFEKEIRQLIGQLDDRPYIATSPKIGWGNEASVYAGDMHYWGVWWGMEPIHKYTEKVPRFMSEYGMQSMPNKESMMQFLAKKDWHLNAPTLLAHQKHATGFATIASYLKQEQLTYTNFDSYIKATQQLQSKAVALAASTHIKAAPYCMGSLVWQWNDCWPAISWSIVDYYGAKKKAYYTLKKIYNQPIKIK